MLTSTDPSNKRPGDLKFCGVSLGYEGADLGFSCMGMDAWGGGMLKATKTRRWHFPPRLSESSQHLLLLHYCRAPIFASVDLHGERVEFRVWFSVVSATNGAEGGGWKVSLVVDHLFLRPLYLAWP